MQQEAKKGSAPPNSQQKSPTRLGVGLLLLGVPGKLCLLG